MKSKLQSVVLMTALIASVITSTIGYTGLWNSFGEKPHDQLREKAYDIVDKAQLWYLRPSASSGGGNSFMNLDFQKLGYDVSGDSKILRSKLGEIRIERLRTFHFDMLIKTNKGVALAARNLSYDARPVFVIE